MTPCDRCATLDGKPASVAPHANLLLYSEAGINFGATATGRAEFYVCHACGSRWERDVARSEPDAAWKQVARLAGE